MIRKRFSKAKRIALCILLAVVVVMFTSQSALAKEEPVEQTEQTSVDYNARVFACCQFWFSFHFGITIVDSEWFKLIYYNIIVNFEIRCWYYWALVMEMGYNSFKWDTDLVGSAEDNFYIWNVNMTLRRYFGKEKFRPFINFGPGLYSPRLGTPRPGLKAGLGVDIRMSNRVYIELGSDYHHMFLKDEDLFYLFTGKKYFFHAHGGIVIRLK
jgi:hypothetical protein